MLMNSLVKYSKTALNYSGAIRQMAYIPKNRLDGKVAVVTASTDGIGFGIARRLALEGAKVVISSRKQKNVDSALAKLKEEGLTAAGLVCHVSKKEDRIKLFDEAVKAFGGVDILVSNAAANPAVGSVLDADEEAWDKIFDINVKAAYLLAKESLPHIRKRGGGSIVFIASIAGYQPFDLLGAYSVSKTTLLGLTKAASQQLATENINVNCIAPGIVKTKFSAAISASKESEEAALSTIPMKRLGKVEDISGVAAFLVSDDAKYITGETIVAAGGMPSHL
ncbi:PREDICTED: dehydrogenase/reductase SDR family member 4 [Nicrophorus vespilloides]|uniref:Dehydrogenase/reductase SDR family member 4 n=1 Tax=Nicrophorus vespilloides TaxID=110193 RepID=A0ABM1N6U9_NICVS|nr:PREDICTED: dehydrogenase/reductase SDR family member 4 [Nicrophorus vespilloides]